MKERWMGLDYGTKTVGVAVSDALGITAQGVETITRKSNKKLRQTLARIEALAEEYEVYPVYFGYDAKGEVCAVYVRFIDIEASYKEQE